MRPGVPEAGQWSARLELELPEQDLLDVEWDPRDFAQAENLWWRYVMALDREHQPQAEQAELIGYLSLLRPDLFPRDRIAPVALRHWREAIIARVEQAHEGLRLLLGYALVTPPKSLTLPRETEEALKREYWSVSDASDVMPAASLRYGVLSRNWVTEPDGSDPAELRQRWVGKDDALSLLHHVCLLRNTLLLDETPLVLSRDDWRMIEGLKDLLKQRESITIGATVQAWFDLAVLRHGGLELKNGYWALKPLSPQRSAPPAPQRSRIE